MRVLWVYAHPDQRSLNGSLRDLGTAVLRERLVALPGAEPVPFRHQNGGDLSWTNYRTHDTVLRSDRAPGENGIGVHVRTGGDTEADR